MPSTFGNLGEIGSVFPSELGWMAGHWVDRRLVAFTFDQPSAIAAAARLAAPHGAAHRGLEADAIRGDGEPVPEYIDRFQERLRAYARGERDAFLDIPLHLPETTPFQHRVIAECRRIAWGCTLSYAELAARAGSPRAARAVGNVMAHNRFPLIVPCHRVVGSTGRLGGFSSPNGLVTKRCLLDRERTECVPSGRPQALG